jgi:hypothetical protein
VSLGRWLKERVVDAPLGGLILRSAQDRQKRACFWITKGKQMSDCGWRETGNGNWVLPGVEGIEATVYATPDSKWGTSIS